MQPCVLDPLILVKQFDTLYPKQQHSHGYSSTHSRMHSSFHELRCRDSLVTSQKNLRIFHRLYPAGHETSAETKGASDRNSRPGVYTQQELMQWKSLEVYNYFDSGHIGVVKIWAISSSNCVLKALVNPSQRSPDDARSQKHAALCLSDIPNQNVAYRREGDTLLISGYFNLIVLPHHPRESRKIKQVSGTRHLTFCCQRRRKHRYSSLYL